jgi:spheroidene monooxygenase
LTGEEHADRAVTRDQVVVLVLADILPSSRLWGWSRFVLGRFPLRQVPGIRFAKVLGSGADGGFGVKPSPSIQGMFCVFDDAASADAFTGPDGMVAEWRRRARECLSVKLRAYSSRGSWAGMRFAVTAAAPAGGPIASLTRASIRPTRAGAFWRMQPAAERALAGAQGCLIAAGVGEAPLLRQATFSVWDEAASMDRYARSGAHQEAILAAGRGGFFSESMFVRFVPYDACGSWHGRQLG